MGCGESAGNSCENGALSPEAVHFPLGRFTFPRGMRLLGRSSRACLGKRLVYRYSEKGHLLDLGRNGVFVAKSGQSSKSPRCKCLTASAMCFGEELDLIKLMMCFGEGLDLIKPKTQAESGRRIFRKTETAA